MLAIVAAACFAIALLVDWLGLRATDLFNYPTLGTLGLLFLALHVAGVGASYDWRRRVTGRRRR